MPGAGATTGKGRPHDFSATQAPSRHQDLRKLDYRIDHVVVGRNCSDEVA